MKAKINGIDVECTVEEFKQLTGNTIKHELESADECLDENGNILSFSDEVKQAVQAAGIIREALKKQNKNTKECLFPNHLFPKQGKYDNSGEIKKEFDGRSKRMKFIFSTSGKFLKKGFTRKQAFRVANRMWNERKVR